MTQHSHNRPAGWTAATLLAATVALSACGGGGGGSSGGNGGGTAGPSQPGATVPDSAMSSTANLLRFMRSWAVDDTIEPYALSDQPPPRDEGDAVSVN
ncbi:MAG: hypothetical protein H0W48_03715 [Methylibium sp.]|uniref:hypothetical protein n=1 Tax=Methylibium sp. TaxID=2067992 RepID=UPI0017F7799C|nr:hypothetical protein [Methylibium sp.]MBA3590729.1 hypothetical protein [Methylibium sp.]MBA3623559.1 hypothetical protein [Methylibium sp.]